MVTHDPREAVYLGGRVIVLGRPGGGIVFDRVVDSGGKRTYAGGAELEKEIIDTLFNFTV
jgi:NitT/TauT family transport system ATP-binding protein